MAEKYDIYYNFVLFGSTNDDATTHQWWEDSTKRQALVRVLTPLFQRYANNPRVHTWETVNEPEWQSRNGITSVAGMLATSDALANAIHQNSGALVTVGNAQMQDMSTWVGHVLDYYSPHYYDPFGTGFNDPFVTSASSAGPDGKPVVIGEFPADTSSSNPNALTRWQRLYALGYAGGWSWSLSPERTYDRIGTDFAAAATFASDKRDLGPQSTALQPSPTPSRTASTPTATPSPTAIATATLMATVTPSLTPTPTPTSSSGQTLIWTMQVTLSTTSVARGGSIRIRDVVSASQAAQALVDIEIYDGELEQGLPAPLGQPVVRGEQDATVLDDVVGANNRHPWYVHSDDWHLFPRLGQLVQLQQPRRDVHRALTSTRPSLRTS